MKKHIFGVALFSLIVASFVFIYAFFYSPSIPPKEAVKPPVSRTEAPTPSRTHCDLKRNKLAYEVQNSEFDLKKNRLTSMVKVTWNGSGAPPEQIFAKTQLFTLGRKEFSETLKTVTFTETFKNRTEATLIIISELEKSAKKLDERQNLYVSFGFSETDETDDSSNSSKYLPEIHQVLFVHGKKEWHE